MEPGSWPGAVNTVRETTTTSTTTTFSRFSIPARRSARSPPRPSRTRRQPASPPPAALARSSATLSPPRPSPTRRPPALAGVRLGVHHQARRRLPTASHRHRLLAQRSLGRLVRRHRGARSGSTRPVEPPLAPVEQPTRVLERRPPPPTPVRAALIATRAAVLKPCASSVPPPQGNAASLASARAMDRLGGRITSAESPRADTKATESRLVYDSARSRSAAPFAAAMRLSAMDPDASTRNTVSVSRGAGHLLVADVVAFDANSSRTFRSPRRFRRAGW